MKNHESKSISVKPVEKYYRLHVLYTFIIVLFYLLFENQELIWVDVEKIKFPEQITWKKHIREHKRDFS